MNCCETVFRNNSFRGSQCRGKGAFTHEGKTYCAVHYPPNVEAKKVERSAKWDAKWEAKKAQWRDEKLGARALHYMRERHPQVVMEWEQEIK